MAKAKNTGVDYTAELNKLKIHGPQRLYMLWGEEDYLRERFVEALRLAVLADGEDDFNYKRMDGRKTDLRDIEEAINSVPFMGDRSFIELRDLDINGLKDDKAERMKAILEDIPDYCTVALVQELLEHPELLELSADTPVECAIRR